MNYGSRRCNKRYFDSDRGVYCSLERDHSGPHEAHDGHDTNERLCVGTRPWTDADEPKRHAEVMCRKPHPTQTYIYCSLEKGHSGDHMAFYENDLIERRSVPDASRWHNAEAGTVDMAGAERTVIDAIAPPPPNRHEVVISRESCVGACMDQVRSVVDDFDPKALGDEHLATVANRMRKIHEGLPALEERARTEMRRRKIEPRYG